jgi:hypothetical protein
MKAYHIVANAHHLNYFINAMRQNNPLDWIEDNYPHVEVGSKEHMMVVTMAHMLKPSSDNQITPRGSINVLCAEADVEYLENLNTLNIFDLAINEMQLEYLLHSAKAFEHRLNEFITTMNEHGEHPTKDGMLKAIHNLNLAQVIPHINDLSV